MTIKLTAFGDSSDLIKSDTVNWTAKYNIL